MQQNHLRALIACLAFVPLTGAADEAELGTLNPEELTINSVVDKASRGETPMMVCAHGYFITKAGQHERAREVFEACADAGYTQAMTWMSYMDDNGLGDHENPVAAAEWDRLAAEAGDPIGEFNYGLDLLRGRGVSRDPILGRKMIDRAAAQGLAVAQELQSSGYDLDVVTPDADNWKYAPNF